MPDRRDVRAGIFVILALILLVLGTVWITGYSPFGVRGASYDIMMQGSSGIRRGDRVRMSGIRVGRVQEIELRPGVEWPVRFNVVLDPGFRVREGSSARITSDGLLGAPYLEIVSGPPEAPILEEGSVLYGVEGGDVMALLGGLGDTTERLPLLIDEVIELVAGLNQQVDPLMAGISSLLSEENVESISDAMRALSATLEEVGPRLPVLLDRLDTLTASLEEGIDDVPELTGDIRGLVGDLRQALGPEGARLAGVLGSAERTLNSADGTLETLAGSREDLRTLLRDLAAAGASLRTLAEDLKQRPSLLLRSPKMPERTVDEEKRP